MLTGVPACTGLHQSELYTAIREYEFDSDPNPYLKPTSDKIREMLAGCLRQDCSQRLSPDEVIKC